MSYLFTSESVSEGHPDKMADQISDAILDAYLLGDKNSLVACETLVTTDLVVVSGEINSKSDIELEKIIRNVIKKIGYNKDEYKFNGDNCIIESHLHQQSSDIRQGVLRKEKENQGAGDQGIMFGYASNETQNYMPLSLELAHDLLYELSVLRRENKDISYLRPDSKSQITIEYDDHNKPKAINSIVVSTQHDPFASDANMLKQIKHDIKTFLIPRVLDKYSNYDTKELFNNDILYHINPTGKFVIGGPHGDTGLTGRKIIVDTYGGKGAHGGGAFSGKDPSKVDRSAAYAARHIAKNLVAAGVAEEILIQLSYAIGIANPIGIYCNTYNSSKLGLNDLEISNKIEKLFDLRPAFIEERLKLRNPIYELSAAYGHMGRNSKKIEISGVQCESFTWEKLDYVDLIKKEFNL